MCESTAYILKNGREELVLESVDVIENNNDGQVKLTSMFGEQKTIKARVKEFSLVDHKIILEST
ncbi:MAG: RNA-binding protein [Desulfobacteraceae bacterium 4484_190.1]|nr:CooT family nickel-binding protein [Deltaproteobacteria bacterium]OPX34707.1 MAG: RNA-binding protein [Desulfobacteraceae bacterium 4484_190.1]